MKKPSGHVLNLSKLPKEAYLKRDIFGRTVLHIAVLANDVTSFKKLLQSPEVRHALLATDYESGWNILHYIFFYKRLGCLNVLLEHLELAPSINATTLAELLKRKDRCRLPPLALLQNDVKDLVWVPQYINERNEYHLHRRFGVSNDVEHSVQQLNPRYIDHDWWLESRGGLNVYVFGSNSNNQLGVGDSTDRSVPSRISIREFHAPISLDVQLREILEKPRFKAIKISKYHSVALTLDGRLFTCGLGSRGRLGHGNVANLYRFKNVEFFNGVPIEDSSYQVAETVNEIAVANNHNLVLTSSNNLYSWGLNSHNQLGFTSVFPQSFKNTTEVYENSPKVVNAGDLRKKSQRILGVGVSKIHSLAYTSNSIYFWGFNIGQMGLPIPELSSLRDNGHTVNGVIYKGGIVPQPKEMTLRDEIKIVSTCETCTCVVTVTNDIYVYFLGQRAKLPKLPARAFSDVKFDCFKPSRLTRAPIIKKVVLKSHENIHILLESGDVMTFVLSLVDPKSLRNVKFLYVWRAYDSDMRAVDIDISFDGSVIVCTKNGSVFLNCALGASLQKSGSMSSLTMPAISSSAKKKFKKVEHVNRVLRVSCDESFSSFAMIRDDIDMMPLKLQKNDFFIDLEYLSVLTEEDLYRKQDQLLDIDHADNSYVADYLYPTNPSKTIENDQSININGLGKEFGDLRISKIRSTCDDLDFVRFQQKHKYDHSNNFEPSVVSMYQQPEAEKSNVMANSMKSKSEIIALLSNPSAFSNKFYDGIIKLLSKPEISIGFHTKLLEYRSTFCKQIFNPHDDGEYFIHEGIKGSYDPRTKTLHFNSDVELRAVLILIHFMYTNIVLSFWEDYPSGLKCPEDIRKVKSDFIKLMDLFRMDSLYGKREAFVNQLQQMANDKSDGDVLITTKEGNEIARSSVLVARSAFFETILSDRWETGDPEDFNGDINQERTSMKYVSLENVNLLQFKIILNHLHGCNDLHVFDAARSIVADSLESDDFVNLLLEMIEITDELLLVQLKHLCELAIKEFISTENVLILLAHADWLSAHKLFMSCCWYIYNNLEIVVFDGNLRDLDVNLVQKLEDQIRFLQNCKSPDFVIGEKGEVDSNFGKAFLELRDVNSVEEFFTAPECFNEIYMSDRKGFTSFQPLRDVKLDTFNGDENRRKQSSRRMSRQSSVDPLADFRKLSIGQILERKASESAVADEEEFELVTNRKRKSKLKPKTDEPTSEHPTRSSRDGSASPTQQSQPPQVSAQVAFASRMDATSSLNTISSGASSFAWVSRNSSTSSVANLQPQSIPTLRGSTETLQRQTKIKFAPSMKLSQKQRRKLAQQEPVDVEGPSKSLELKNPWKVPVVVENGSSSADQDLPVLGAEKKEHRPSLTAIMLLESTRIEERKIQASPQRTLQEVQQEQEFAKWWEEESKKVQMEMKGQSGSANGSHGLNGKGRPNEKLRRGSRKKSFTPL